MPDIPPIQGPAHNPENARRHERTTADADKFKQEMIRKRSQIGETDPEQQKKRKQQAEEDEEENPLKEAPGPAAPPTSFHIDEQDGPLGIKKGISPISSTAPPPSPHASQSMMASPAPLAEEQPLAPASPTVPTVTPTSTTTPTPPVYPQNTPQSLPNTTNTAPSPPSDASKTQANSSQTPTPPDTSDKEDTESLLIDTGMTLQELEMKAIPSMPESNVQPSSGIIQTTASEEEEEATQAIAPVAADPESLKSSPLKKKAEGDVVTAQDAKGAPPMPLMPFGTMGPHGVPPPPAAYTSLSLPMLNLFERMVGVMTVMTDSRMSETTITLNSRQFASSIFYGTQIVIREYTSAPKAFNIQLNSHPEAVALFRGNADALMAAFQYGNYQFRVNRLDTNLLSERPLFRRKEKISGDAQDQPEQGP